MIDGKLDIEGLSMRTLAWRLDASLAADLEVELDWQPKLGNGQRDIDGRTMRELASLADGSLAPDRASQLRRRVQREPRLADELALQRRALAPILTVRRQRAPVALRNRVALLICQAARARRGPGRRRFPGRRRVPGRL